LPLQDDFPLGQDVSDTKIPKLLNNFREQMRNLLKMFSPQDYQTWKTCLLLCSSQLMAYMN